MNLNVKPSDQVTILAVINPVSQGATTVTSDWVDMSALHGMMAVLQSGVLGTNATIDAKLRQAKNASGGSAKDITGKAVTQLVKASNDNDQVILNCRADELDVNNGFTHAQLSITVGTAASLISAILLGVGARYQPKAHVSSVVEVIP